MTILEKIIQWYDCESTRNGNLQENSLKEKKTSGQNFLRHKSLEKCPS